MKTQPILPARVALDGNGLPYAPDFGDVYHPEAGAFAQARHVFLAGNGLPARWAGRERFVILETGFGLGNNFLATWAAWRDDPARCERLVFVSIEKHPLRHDDLTRVHAASPEPALARQLVAQWPLSTPNLHLLDFESGRVQLILAFGDAQALLPELQAEVDAVYLDGFAPSKNAAMWSPEVFRRLTRLLAPGCTAATWSFSRPVRDGLASIGFEVQRAPGLGGKRDMTVARWAPRFVPPRPAAFRAAPVGPREALVIGGGLAGCAAAWGLSLQGWHATVLDRQPEPALETSGNPGGLMHGIFNAPDGLHARWYRSAALHTARWAAPALTQGRVAGRLDGFLRLDAHLSGDGLLAAQRQLATVGLDPAYVTAIDAATAGAAAGLPPSQGAWSYAGAGWLSPRDWSRELLACSGATWRGGQAVQRLRREGATWRAWDAEGRLLGEAPVLVLAHAAGLRQCWPDRATPPQVRVNRGQTTVLPADFPALRRPRMPLSGRGYALALPSGEVLIGATQQSEDPDPHWRADDQRHNVQRAAAIGVCADIDPGPLPGRVGWRVSVPDRLPLVGPPRDPMAPAPARADALRHLPRCHAADHGLYVLTALGSRGLTSAALAGRVLAAWISGAPCPVENDLRDALDPARLPPAG